MYVEFYDQDGTLAHHDWVKTIEQAKEMAQNREFRTAQECPISDSDGCGNPLLNR